MKRQVEVLAPAGSMESMIAAVNAGADAIYMGGSRFGARAYADNPQEDQFLEAIDYAHLHGCRLYMTVNTLMKESEMEELYGFLKPCYERGLDAVIVQDMGVFSFVRRYFPDLPVHASTQMTVTGPGMARMLKEQGAARVVTARELSLEEIAKIRDQVDIEIESFVHGALCYCYSGQCLMSSLIGGRSGNRGRCAQPCRLPYDLLPVSGRGSGQGSGAQQCGRESQCGSKKGLSGIEQRGGSKKGSGSGELRGGIKQAQILGRDDRYVLSMKDLCTLDILPDMIEAGVYSLKIEGRMKSPRYTAGVVSVYRKYVDLYLEKGRRGYRVDPADRKLLLDLFDRGGLTEGYYRQHNGRDMIALKEKPAFRETDKALFDRLDEEYVNKKKQEPVFGTVYMAEGELVRLELSMGRPDAAAVGAAGPDGSRIFVMAEGARVQTAQSQPMSEEKLKKQLNKTGNTPFYFKELTAVVEGSCFLPLQALNELRRQGLEELFRAVLEPFRRSCGGMQNLPDPGAKPRRSETGGVQSSPASGRQPACPKDHPVSLDPSPVRPSIHVLLEEPETLPAVLSFPEVASVYLDSCGFGAKSWEAAAESCHRAGKQCVLVMPHIFRMEARRYFTEHKKELKAAGFDEVLVKALEEVCFLRDHDIGFPMIFDANLYTMNHLAADWMLEAGARRLTLPLELHFKELERLAKGNISWELVAYGHFPAMVSAQCVTRTLYGCGKKPGILFMKDRTGKVLPVKNHCRFCYNTIYNPAPLSLLGLEQEVERLRPSVLRLQFSVEEAHQVRGVVDAYIQHFVYGNQVPAPFGDFTRGHWKRGVE